MSPPLAPPPASVGLTVLIGVLIALTAVIFDSTLPITPEIARQLGGEAAAAQFTLTTYFAGIALGQLVWGPLSDRIGRRPALLAGLVLALASSAACALSGNLALLAAARLAQGFAASVGPVIGRSVVRDLYSHEQAARLLARAMIVFGIVPIAAPLVGSTLLELFGWRAVFGLHAAIAAALLAVLAARFAETAPADRRPPPLSRILHTYAGLLADRRFLYPYLVQLMIQIGIMAWVTHSGFALIRGAQVSPGAYALMFAGVMLGQIAGAWATSRLVMRRGIPAMIRRGARLAFIAGVIMAALAAADVSHWAAVVVPTALFLFAASFVLPHTTAAALTPFPQSAGAASSLMGAIQFAIGAGVSALLGVLFDGSMRPMIYAMAASGLAALFFERTLYRRVAKSGLS